MITASAFQHRLQHSWRSVDVSLPAGQVRWLEAQEHAGENIADTETLTFVVELETGAAVARRRHPPRRHRWARAEHAGGDEWCGVRRGE